MVVVVVVMPAPTAVRLVEPADQTGAAGCPERVCGSPLVISSAPVPAAPRTIGRRRQELIALRADDDDYDDDRNRHEEQHHQQDEKNDECAHVTTVAADRHARTVNCGELQVPQISGG
ncbi:hypothetical protein [Nocardia gipuzkoensis]|uniref:hypothetical protein n=1 Tax=Nocardia gipuzkoensis TaxID=2749991 RepID=UPI0015EEC7FC|nr:hypothetical protein [Nocardia gipuzkoensis]